MKNVKKAVPKYQRVLKSTLAKIEKLEATVGKIKKVLVDSIEAPLPDSPKFKTKAVEVKKKGRKKKVV